MSNRYDHLDINNKLIWNLRDIGHTLLHISEGKGSQKRILIILNDCGNITQSELTRRLDIKPGSASEVLGKLESAGLIVRTPNKTDCRTADVQLTPKGRVEAQKAAKQREERHEKMFECLTEGEKGELLSLLEKINVDWDVRYQGKESRGYRRTFCKK